MKIAIMGAGGVGGYYGGLLARKGNDVTFIARGAHLRAIRQKGLHVKSMHGDFLVPVQASDNPREIGVVDLVLFTTKTYHTNQAAQAIKPMIGKDTMVVSLQNGVDRARIIGTVVGMDHLVSGTTWVSAAIEVPGVIEQYSRFRSIIIGEFDGRITGRLRRFADVFKSTGVTVELVEDIARSVWTKFILVSSVSAIGSLTRVTFGDYRAVPEARAVLTQALNEVAAIARAKEVVLDQDVVTNSLAFIDSSPPTLKPSMQRDVEAQRLSELESMVGVVARLGCEVNVPTPVMRFAYSVLKPGHLRACSRS